MSGKAWIALIFIVLITLVVSDFLFGLFFTWLGKMVLKYKEHKKKKFASYVIPHPSDGEIIPADELFKKE